MNIKTLKNISYTYLILPVIFFFIGWLKLLISVPLSIALIIAIYLINKKNNEKHEVISSKTLMTVFIVILIVCILAGQGGFFYQSNDHHWRNAIFRDLINEEWPVYYEKSETYLDYYIAHWLVPAGIAKAFLPISQNYAWAIGNTALLLWSTIGVTLAVIWVLNGIKNKSKGKIAIALAIFILFSGLDMIGIFKTNNIINMHIEWWAIEYQFSSMMTQLFWVFNQAIPTWLIMMLFLNEKNVSNYFMLIILLLPYAPLPFIGAIPLFACNGFRCLYKSIKEKQLKQFFKEVFSIQNIIALTCILPIYYLYYSLNQATTNSGFALITYLLTFEGIINLLLFWLLEIGIYGIAIYKQYQKSPLFWVAFISLIFIPLFSLGGARDFAMRASIPSLMVCMIFVIDYLVNKFDESKTTITGVIIVLLIIGAITPGFEFGRGFKRLIDNNFKVYPSDGIVTFSNKQPAYYANFLAQDAEDSIFVKYLMKK